MFYKHLLSSLLLTYILTFSSCSPYSKITKRYDIKEAKVKVNEKVSHRYPQEGFHRFIISSDTPDDMVFATRCAFEEKGFKHVAYGERPEMIVSVETALPYRITYIPPKETVFETKNQEGFIVQKHFSSPAYAERFFQPRLNVRVYDFQSKKLVWQSIGSGEVLEKHKDLSHQILLRQAIASLPMDKEFNEKKPYFDLDFIVLSEDKKNYYPKVLQVHNTELRYNLKENDTLTEFNGRPLGNLSYKEVLDIIESSQRQQKPVALKLKRNEEVIAFDYQPSYRLPEDIFQKFSPKKMVETEMVYVKPFDVIRGKDPLTTPKNFDITENEQPKFLQIQPEYPKTKKEEVGANTQKSKKDIVLRPSFLNNLEEANHYMKEFQEELSFIDEQKEETL
ncbi:MAG: hypothetical protein L7U87_03200 [Chlamydiales bacterium]|nr:hypothetical protein [Chlamydiales bacterium]